MKKKNKLKESYKRFNEIWAVPRYRAAIKLSLYAIMFLILIIMANTYNDTNDISPEVNNEKSYTEILKSTNIENLEIDSTITINNNIYIIDGNIKNGILNGYLENNGNIKKIKIENNMIYNIISNSDVLDEELNNIIIRDFLFPKTIISIINNESAYIEKLEKNVTYTYNILYNNISYEVKLISDLEVFTNINIKGNNAEYNLNIN